MNRSLLLPNTKLHAAARLTTALLLIAAGAPAAVYASGHHTRTAGVVKADAAHERLVRRDKLDRELTSRSRTLPNATTRVIVRVKEGATLPPEFKVFARRTLALINGHVADVPNRLLKQLAADPAVFDIHYDRPTAGADYRTDATIGSRAVEHVLGLTGAGVGIAVIDSGVTSWHDDLTNTTMAMFPYGNQRVAAFVDFVNGQAQPYDDNGHGTHVAGIIAGNGYDSQGANAGVAPEASLIVLKALDGNGQGSISQIIAALDWVVANKDAYNIRIVNLSVGAGIYESYWTDPLTLAAKRAVDAGVVVVSAAGNMGHDGAGVTQYGGISSPANAPWVLTIGASSTMGTTDRGDDTMAGYSSRGPTYLDWSAKPDLVAPGTGTVSLADPTSLMYGTRSAFLVPGSIATADLPYLSLSGTSMAAPVVSGVVAQMLQANPSLTPNAVKAILEYTAQTYGGYDPLTQGAGFLNGVGAVRLARFFATARAGDVVPIQPIWSKHIIWGNHLLSNGFIEPVANAFDVTSTWGAARTTTGQNIVWGDACGDAGCDNIVWGSMAGDNIVWGDACADASCDNIVWGSMASDNIVWGDDCGGADCDNIVWGSLDPLDNIVWGNMSAGDNIVWGDAGLNADNIVWGNYADGDNIVWGSVASGDNIVWGSSTSGDLFTGAPITAPTTSGPAEFDMATDAQLFGWVPPDASATPLPIVDILPPVPLVPLESTVIPTDPALATPTIVIPTIPTIDPTISMPPLAAPMGPAIVPLPPMDPPAGGGF